MIIPITTANPAKYAPILEINNTYGLVCSTPELPDKEYITNSNKINPIIKNPISDKVLYVVKNSKLFL